MITGYFKVEILAKGRLCTATSSPPSEQVEGVDDMAAQWTFRGMKKNQIQSKQEKAIHFLLLDK